MSRLELSLLGPFTVSLDGKLITGFESVKVRALLAYLTAEYARPHPRERLAALLWPDWPQQSAMSNLRYALADLRKVIGDRDAHPPYLLVTRESLQLNCEADIGVDVIEFEGKRVDPRSGTIIQQSIISNQQSTILDSQSAISLYRGEFLEGFSLDDSPVFEEWLLAKRAYYSQLVLQALNQLADHFEKTGDYNQVEGYARRQIELEPWRETAHRQLMRALSLKGERVQALAQFESLRKALKRELDVQPSEETIDLYQQIRDGSPPARKEILTEGRLSILPEIEKPSRNLPLQLTSFIGRDQEIAEIRDLVLTSPSRMVTLTGPGGIGKTRLALHVADVLVEGFEDGVCLVELASLIDPDLLPQTIAKSLGVKLASSTQGLTGLQDYLEERHLLLILDNCEQLVEACARLVDGLLRACPNLHLLSTSREPLGIDGEAVYRVPPLAVPDIHLHLSSVNLIQYDAIRLFTERAAVVFPGFTLDAQSGSAVLQICRRLDGIPLAIELAAARVKMSQVEEIAQHLEDSFRLLTGGSRAALPRYQTLRASIDWSYMLLTGAEQTLLQCLSVFAGGWTLEAAESVGNGEEVDAGEVINLLGGLVDKSLVNVMRESGRETRYRMLETIRQYAHEKLVESGQSAAVCDRHLQYYVDLAERLEDKIRGRVGDQVRSRLDSELEDIRLAQTWSLEGSDRPGWNPEPGLRLAAALHWFWIINTLWEEERPWLVRLLALEAQSRGDQPAREARARIRARALFTASYMTMTIGEHKPAREMITESRELFRGLGPQDVRGYAFATWVLSEIESSLGELLRAKLLVEESLAFFRTTGDRFGEFDCLFTLGNIASQQMAYEQASQYYQASLEIRQEVGDTGIPLMLMSLARMLLNQWEFEKARPILEQSLQLASEYQDNYSLPLDLAYLGRIDWMAGQYEQAARNFEEIIGFGRRIGTAWIVHIGLAQMGELALSQGDTVQAGDWLGQSLALARKMERKDLIAISLCGLGSLALDQGRIEQAAEAYAEVLALSQERGDKIYEMIATFGLGKVEHARHDRLLAQKNYLEALDMCSDQLFLEYEKEETIEALAFVAVDQQQFDRAALLLGASEAWHVKFQRWRTPRERQERESAITALRVGMGEKAFATAWAEGVATSSNQALDEARKIR